MNEEQQKKLLDLIQKTLEQFKDSGKDIVFFSSIGGRGMVSGTYEGLSALLLYNMVAYPQFKAIIDISVEAYPKLYDKVKEFVDEHKPSHEIVDNYGLDIEKLVNNIIPKNNEEDDEG